MAQSLILSTSHQKSRRSGSRLSGHKEEDIKPDAKLIDLAIRESIRGVIVPPTFRDRLFRARKFVLDSAMSAHLADLSCAPFVERDQLFVYQVADGARRMARLPHPVTWIEYDCRARKARTEAEYAGLTLSSSSGAGLASSEVIPRVGWLLEEHPHVPAAYKMTEFSQVDGDAVAMPMSYTWVADDNTPLPWKNLPIDTSEGGRHPSELASGVFGYVNDHVGVTASEGYEKLNDDHRSKAIRMMMLETLGELRAAWTLLATINDLPVVFDNVRPSRGQMVKGGNYRRFVDHSVIRLVVPAHRSLRTLATRALIAMHRRAHEVRGHWRNDWRHPRTPGCEHDWINHDDHTLACRHCSGRRVWITAHQRGDASKGIVIHNYSVERPAA